MKNFFIRWIKKNYKKIPVFNYLVNKLKVSSLFWRYRHLFERDVWEHYSNDSTNKRRNFYSDFVSRKLLNLIYEFGCASGPNLMNIQKNVKEKVFLVGYDINRKAIKKAKKEFDLNNSFFFDNLTHSRIEEILRKRKRLFFDLVIFDRVFFLFGEKEIKKHLSEYEKYYKFVILDDFHNKNKKIKFRTYSTKDYIKLFSNFELISIEESEHIINGEFFRLYAKRIVFRNKRL